MLVIADRASIHNFVVEQEKDGKFEIPTKPDGP
jgi:hypothetical protein